MYITCAVVMAALLVALQLPEWMLGWYVCSTFRGTCAFDFLVSEVYKVPQPNSFSDRFPAYLLVAPLIRPVRLAVVAAGMHQAMQTPRD